MRLKNQLAKCQNQNRIGFVGFLMAGYPRPESTVPCLLAMQAAGVDVIELGVPFTDPLADGPVIQAASQIALSHKSTRINLEFCLKAVRDARESGLTVPVVLMGYWNPVLQYQQQNSSSFLRLCVDSGIDGFIIVDLPPDEPAAQPWLKACRDAGLSFIPLISPTTSQVRMQQLCHWADSFVYVVSSMGVTGVRSNINTQNLEQYLDSIRKFTSLPLAVGFGIGNRQQVEMVGQWADCVVVGSQLIQSIGNAEPGQEASLLKQFLETIVSDKKRTLPSRASSSDSPAQVAHAAGLSKTFGQFGGQYAPETLMFALDELEKMFIKVKDDPEFWNEIKSYYDFVGRPSKLQLAKRLTETCGGARIWLKREDLNHTGSHKINNALGQILLAKRLGKKRIIAETGAGQHGVATATVCAHFNLECIVYMGKVDTDRQKLNVFRMHLLGAKVIPVTSGQATLKDAINAAMRDWVTNVETTHYLVGSAIGPHPFPTIVREFQSVIGREVKEQMMALQGKLPDVCIACVGGGSNAIGLFHPFENEKRTGTNEPVQLIGVEAGGDGVETGHHSAPLTAGKPGVLHGCSTYLMQDANGQIAETHSISAGLDYPGVGPEHAFLKDSGRAKYVAATDREALVGFQQLSMTEGIIPALETAHAIHHAIQLAPTLPKSWDIVVSVSGRGDKDVQQVEKALSKFQLSLRHPMPE